MSFSVFISRRFSLTHAAVVKQNVVMSRDNLVYGLLIGGLAIVLANSLVGLMLVALAAMKLAFEST